MLLLGYYLELNKMDNNNNNINLYFINNKH